MSALRLALLGCGRLAERGYLPALARVPTVELVALVDPEVERARALPASAPCHASLADALAAGPLDAVVVAAPVALHLALAREAAEAGLPALVEKPPAADAAGAAALAALAPAPHVGLNRRFDPGLGPLRAALDGASGYALDLVFTAPADGWRPHTPPPDALLDLGVHLADLARWLPGDEPLRVRAATLSPAGAEVEIELARGRARLRCAAGPAYREQVDARLTDGRSLAHGHGGLRRRLASRLGGGAADPLVETLAAQLAAFAVAVRGEPAPTLATAADGLAALRLLDAARASAAAGGAWTPLA